MPQSDIDRSPEVTAVNKTGQDHLGYSYLGSQTVSARRDACQGGKHSRAGGKGVPGRETVVRGEVR